MNKMYSQNKVCASCGHDDQRLINSRIAAFEETRAWHDSCPKCGSKETKSSGVEIPDLTEELMLLWSQNLDLSFDLQDEDLFMSYEGNIEILFKYLDSDSTLTEKKSIILAALCVLIHDNIPDIEEDDSEIDIAVADRIAIELKNRMSIFAELNTDIIMDYIKEQAYPHIGVPLSEM